MEFLESIAIEVLLWIARKANRLASKILFDYGRRLGMESNSKQEIIKKA